jgi:hypothetical protein
MDLKETGCEVVNWIQLAQDRDQWRALVNTVMKLFTPLRGEEFLGHLSDSFSKMVAAQN